MMIEQLNDKNLSKQNLDRQHLQSISSSNQNRNKEASRHDHLLRSIGNKTQHGQNIVDKRKIRKQVSRRTQNSTQSANQSKNRHQATFMRKGNLGGGGQGNQGQQMRSSPKLIYRLPVERQRGKPQQRSNINMQGTYEIQMQARNYNHGKMGRNYHKISIQDQQQIKKNSHNPLSKFSPKQTYSSREGIQSEHINDYYKFLINQSQYPTDRNQNRSFKQQYIRGDSKTSEYLSTPINQIQYNLEGLDDSNRMQHFDKNLLSPKCQDSMRIINNSKQGVLKLSNQQKLASIRLNQNNKQSANLDLIQNYHVLQTSDRRQLAQKLKKGEFARGKLQNQVEILTTSGYLQTHSPIKSSSILSSKQMQKNMQNHYSSSIGKVSSRYHPNQRPKVEEFSIARELKD